MTPEFFPLLPIMSPLNASEPLWKFVGRLQIETMALMSRRAQACMELPSRLATASTPHDYITEQVLFWQVAQRHYMQSFDTVAGMVPLPGKSAVVEAAPPKARDYMVVSDRSTTADGATVGSDHIAAREPVRATVPVPTKVRRSA